MIEKLADFLTGYKSSPQETPDPSEGQLSPSDLHDISSTTISLANYYIIPADRFPQNNGFFPHN
ncbi:hypothetical protein, partial [Evtepia sp.]|uniref:hypothetical protein n=1 Tax=Evtepia sp. TaxID=2773933 RepID=UPI003F14CFCD